ncbi:MAG: endonuclease/exonuclease/phosphatase family protein [Woeseiaceae bacterium]
MDVFLKSWRLLLMAAFLLPLPACSHEPVATRSGIWSTADDVSNCRALLTSSRVTDNALDPSSIRLFNWNLQKSRQPHWRNDIETLASAADLVLIQEASIREETIDKIDSSLHWSFAPGYSTPGEITGVMTLSKSPPISQCSFAAAEPWLRTPKAASVTQYALRGSDETLVVVNIHAVNFTFGTNDYSAQFSQLAEVLKAHTGPIILSGDLNTWRGKRVRIVADLAESLSMTAVDFARDNRKTVFGKALDHIYVRGLEVLDADTAVVDSSDHNPMIAEFGVAGEPSATAVLAE